MKKMRRGYNSTAEPNLKIKKAKKVMRKTNNLGVFTHFSF